MYFASLYRPLGHVVSFFWCVGWWGTLAGAGQVEAAREQDMASDELAPSRCHLCVGRWAVAPVARASGYGKPLKFWGWAALGREPTAAENTCQLKSVVGA